MFGTVLVANRGEIAVRVVRTLRRLGIRSVAVYSDADAGARHVREADVAVRLGPAPARESYLSVQRILQAAARTGAEAVHPGYGFLAENADFLLACDRAGLVPVAPPAAAVRTMGDKIRARAAVVAVGVPVVPGRSDPAATDTDLLSAAADLGLPLLVKPSAGGGGKGMHAVHRLEDLPAALTRARREAAASFGDDSLLLERLVQRPRHVEVQVLADAAGTTVHLGERECSLQRRHQKVVEEAPSPLLDPQTRERWGALAVAAARAVRYSGAGTVEFIVSGDAPDEPYFMEMNTRLQVEHPVTEQVVTIDGRQLDLVELQLRVAAGEPLPFAQSGVRLAGSSVEARLYAEDPARGFLPTGGRVLLLREPVGPGVRVDSGLAEGDEVGTAYDPMLAKVVAWGEDRAQALDRLDRALSSTVVLGVTTNAPFLRALLAHPDVRAGRLDTELVERELDGLLGGSAAALPGAVLAAYGLARLSALHPAGARVDPWDVPSGWRPGEPAPLRLAVAGPDGPVAVEVHGEPADARVRTGGAEVRASSTPAPDGMLLTVDGTTRTALVAQRDGTWWIALDGATYALSEAPPVVRGRRTGARDGEVRSPMPGTVLTVDAAPGQQVEAGTPLLVVEAMKMEHTLRAPIPGRLAEVAVRPGDRVAVDQRLARVEP